MIAIVSIGIIIFFVSHVRNELYDKFDNYFEQDNLGLNNSEAQTALQKIQDAENSSWDYAFLAIFVGFIIQLMLFSFASEISIAFYWILVIVDIIILIVGVALSNIWQQIAADSQFAVTITRFPIMNAVLGTYYPMAIVVMLFLAMAILFGKPQQGRVA